MQNTSTPLDNQQPNSPRPLFCAVVGPTASGKSDLALHLAQRVGGEILSVDAMQVYRNLDIGTAKPTPEDRARVRHHGLDWVDPQEHFSASRYVELAEPILTEAFHLGKPLILCGGTGLYYRALLEGLFEAPDPDPDLREALRHRAQSEGSEALHRELAEKDPETALGIHPNDARRITRALEIIEQTGCRVSELRARQEKKGWMRHTCFLGLRREREDLKNRIEKRTQWMYDNGLIEETKMLLDLECGDRHTAFQALGYKECKDYILGRISLEDAEKLTARNTERYAKRQMTWFRLQLPTQWIEAKETSTTEEILYKSMQLWGYSDHNNIL